MKSDFCFPNIVVFPNVVEFSNKNMVLPLHHFRASWKLKVAANATFTVFLRINLGKVFYKSLLFWVMNFQNGIKNY